MHDRVVKKRYRLCRLTLMGLLAGHGIASAQEQPAGASSTAAEQATPSYPPCDRTPTDGDIAGAKGAFQAGAAAYNEADYERAITYWEDAFRRDCTATPLLLNLARAYESSLQYASAILALKTFNERNQDSPQTAQIERRIERLEELLEAQTPPAAPVVVPEPEPEPQPEPVTAAPTQNTKPAENPPRNQAPLYVSIIGGGVAVLSGVLYLKERHDLDGFEDQCGSDRKKCPDDATTKEAEKARKGALFFGWTTGLGATVGAAGLILYLVQGSGSSGNAAHNEHIDRTVRVTPAVLPDFAGLSVDGHF